MEDQVDLQQPDSVPCENCGNIVPTAQKFCARCSFPAGGTDDEKIKFRVAVGDRKRHLNQAKEKMKTAKIIIYVLAGLVLLTGLYQGFVNDDFVTMIVNLCLSVIYLILAAWSDKNPFGAILTAFVLYITLNVINMFYDPRLIFQGIFIKIFFIGAFIKGIRSAKEAQDHMAALEKLKGGDVGAH